MSSKSPSEPSPSPVSETDGLAGVKVKIEVCVDSVESALAAIQGGADRLEICGRLALGGGTTPSLGLVCLIKQSCPENVELMVMVRPRTGDFLYSQHEISVMLEDIGTFADLHITGVVFGALNADGSVDVRSTKILVEEAVKYGMQVCFHRAFDMAVDQYQALGALCTIPGITRILTSGGKLSAPAGLETLTSLLESVANNNPRTLSEPDPGPDSDVQTTPEIMPGSGINAITVGPILRTLLPLGCRAVHLSGGTFVDSTMQYRREGMGMGVGQGGPNEWGVWRTDQLAVRKVRGTVDRQWQAYMNSGL